MERLYIGHKFLLTRELGRLAKWLRILGYDTEYFNQNNISFLIIQALRDGRIIITRNSHLPRSRGIRIVLIEAEKIKEQIRQVVNKLNIKPQEEIMFSRCIICNVELSPISKSEAKDRVPEYVFKTQEDYVGCPKCNRIYWQGSHWGNVKDILRELNLS